jgi:hypothetical protein
MISIRVCAEQLRSQWIRGISQTLVKCARKIAEKMFDCFPVCRTWIGHETVQDSHCMSNIWIGCNGQVHQCTNSIDIGDGLHEVNVLRCCSSHKGIKAHSWIKGSRDRAALCESKTIEHVQDILALA